MPKYEVIESRHWFHEATGRTASVYGAMPPGGVAAGWKIVQRGWTVFNPLTSEVGVGRAPWATREEAEAFAAKFTPSRIGIGD